MMKQNLVLGITLLCIGSTGLLANGHEDKPDTIDRIHVSQHPACEQDPDKEILRQLLKGESGAFSERVERVWSSLPEGERASRLKAIQESLDLSTFDASEAYQVVRVALRLSPELIRDRGAMMKKDAVRLFPSGMCPLLRARLMATLLGSLRDNMDSLVIDKITFALCTSEMTEEDRFLLAEPLWRIDSMDLESRLMVIEKCAQRFFMPHMTAVDRLNLVNALLCHTSSEMNHRLDALIQWESLLFKQSGNAFDRVRLLLTGLSLAPTDINARMRGLGLFVNPLFAEERGAIHFPNLVMAVLSRAPAEVKARVAILRKRLSNDEMKHLSNPERADFILKSFGMGMEELTTYSSSFF
jgi:hypothetical protein